MSRIISSVLTASFSIEKSNPAKLHVTASGLVTSSGWRGGVLIPAVNFVQPPDGIQDFEFQADPPTGIALAVISAISGDGEIELEHWIKGFRVRADKNSATVLLSDEVVVDRLKPEAEQVYAGPKRPKIAGGNGWNL